MLNVIGVDGGISLHVVDGHLKCMSPSDQFPDRKFKVLLIVYYVHGETVLMTTEM